MIITVLGKKEIRGISPKTGNRYYGTLIEYSCDSEQGKSCGTVYVSDMICYGCNIHIFSDYKLEIAPGENYATQFELVEHNSFFKKIQKQHIVQASEHIN